MCKTDDNLPLTPRLGESSSLRTTYLVASGVSGGGSNFHSTNRRQLKCGGLQSLEKNERCSPEIGLSLTHIGRKAGPQHISVPHGGFVLGANPGTCGAETWRAHKLWKFPRCLRALTLSINYTMALNPTSGSASIFKDGKLKPGIYRIQSLYTQTIMDIHEHSRDVCCRPATLLAEGMGLVRPVQQPAVDAPDH